MPTPAAEPVRPISTVSEKGIGSGPGTARRARLPNTKPAATAERIAPSIRGYCRCAGWFWGVCETIVLAMAELPSGTITFLFTDIEGSTQLLKRLGGRYATLLATHRQLLREAAAASGGSEMGSEGDAMFFWFPRVRQAVTAAAESQRALARHDWDEGEAIRARMGLHTGEP